MDREQFVIRIRLFGMFFIFIAFILLLRHLTFVLNYNYSLNGLPIQLLAALGIALTFNFVYISYLYFKKVGPNAAVTMRGMYSEWQAYTPLEKLNTVASLLGLLVTLMTIVQWLSDFTAILYKG